MVFVKLAKKLVKFEFELLVTNVVNGEINIVDVNKNGLDL